MAVGTRRGDEKEHSHPTNMTDLVLPSSAKEKLVLGVYFFLRLQTVEQIAPCLPVHFDWRTSLSPAADPPAASAARWEGHVCGLRIALPFHLPGSSFPTVSDGENHTALRVSRSSPPSSRCQANSKVKAHTFMKQAGVLLGSVLHGNVETERLPTVCPVYSRLGNVFWRI